MTTKNDTKLSPSTIVKAKYPEAKVKINDNGSYICYNYGQKGPYVIGTGSTAVNAWKDAAKNLIDNNTSNKKLSRRRQRIGEKIANNQYQQKFSTESKNILYRTIN